MAANLVAIFLFRHPNLTLDYTKYTPVYVTEESSFPLSNLEFRFD